MKGVRSDKPESYKLLGSVLHILGSGNSRSVIVRVRGKGVRDRGIEKLLNSVVVDEDRREIGRVYDIFGPVKHPYITVRLFRGVNLAELRSGGGKVFVHA